MNNDFKPDEGHRFNLSAAWGTVDGQVQTVEQNKTLTYTWDTKDLRSVVTWTLNPSADGAVGLPGGSAAVLSGSQGRWPQFLTTLEQVLARMD